MTCESCQAAEQNPNTGLFDAGCQDCSLRMLAGSLDYWVSAQDGTPTEGYKAALRSITGDDWKAGHKRVKEWNQRMKGASDGHDQADSR